MARLARALYPVEHALACAALLAAAFAAAPFVAIHKHVTDRERD